jgi:hypothetical protein
MHSSYHETYENSKANLQKNQYTPDENGRNTDILLKSMYELIPKPVSSLNL